MTVIATIRITPITGETASSLLYIAHLLSAYSSFDPMAYEDYFITVRPSVRGVSDLPWESVFLTINP